VEWVALGKKNAGGQKCRKKAKEKGREKNKAQGKQYQNVQRKRQHGSRPLAFKHNWFVRHALLP
jgi:hypothetical protein